MTGGSGFTAPPPVSIINSGGGQGALGFALLSVRSILILSSGRNYTVPPSITILGRSCLLDGGRPAQARAVMAPDPVRGLVVSSIVVEDPGLGYICTPEVSIVDSATPLESRERLSGLPTNAANCVGIAVLTVGAVQVSSLDAPNV